MTVQEAMFYSETMGQDRFQKMEGHKFAYALDKSIRHIRSAVREAYTKSGIDKEKSLEYDRKRRELQVQFCDKDDDGKPVVKDGRYVGLEENEEFDSSLDKLDEEYKDVRDEEVAFQATEVNVKLHKVLPGDLPKAITAEDLKAIRFIVREK